MSAGATAAEGGIVTAVLGHPFLERKPQIVDGRLDGNLLGVDYMMRDGLDASNEQLSSRVRHVDNLAPFIQNDLDRWRVAPVQSYRHEQVDRITFLRMTIAFRRYDLVLILAKMLRKVSSRGFYDVLWCRHNGFSLFIRHI